MLFKFIISFIAGIGTGFTTLTGAVLTVLGTAIIIVNRIK